MKADFSSPRDTPAVLRAVQRAEGVSAPSVEWGWEQCQLFCGHHTLGEASR